MKTKSNLWRRGSIWSRFAPGLFAMLVLSAATATASLASAAPRERKARETDPEKDSRSTAAKTSSSKSAPIKPMPPVKQQIRGVLGLASGLKYVGSPVFVLGADYTRTIRPHIDIVAGLTRWSNTYSDPAFSIDFALTTIDAGMEYNLPLSDEITIKALARAGVGLASSSSQEAVLGELEKKSDSATVFGLTVGGGGVWKSGNMEFGGELRKPILFGDLAEGSSVVYLVGTIAFNL